MVDLPLSPPFSGSVQSLLWYGCVGSGLVQSLLLHGWGDSGLVQSLLLHGWGGLYMLQSQRYMHDLFMQSVIVSSQRSCVVVER